MNIHSQMIGSSKLTILPILLTFLLLAAVKAGAGDIEDRFSSHDNTSKVTVDHSAWDKMLGKYVAPDNEGLNRVNYKAFKQADHKNLKTYISSLEAVDVTKLGRNEQFALWANLYNAVTIDVILDHYPTKSIRDIDISPGLFANGPWGKKLVTVNGLQLSLDDIEHKILRGLWKDPRVHYAVNCASIGCPNLAAKAYTGETLETMLNAGAKAFINSPRGVAVNGDRITASKIYSWFGKDFGSSEKNILKHIRKYASPALAKKLAGKTDISGYEYNWSLNDVTNSL
ncbi:MAG: DUF547 domain-containing protein [Methyloligellaceae bacterium]